MSGLFLGAMGAPIPLAQIFLRPCVTASSWPAWQPLATRRLPSVPQAQMLVREKRNVLVAERVKAQEQVPHQGCNSALPLPITEEIGRILSRTGTKQLRALLRIWSLSRLRKGAHSCCPKASAGWQGHCLQNEPRPHWSCRIHAGS